MTETLCAADRLAEQGIAADVVCLTSPGLLFEALRARRGLGAGASWILEQVFPAHRAAPMVTVLDGHPHTLAFLAGINNVPASMLGVTGSVTSDPQTMSTDITASIPTASSGPH